ncbi:carboxypeptidase B [Pieris rapae]|uniref:carboxypeptidase B n=1 Tax=Pieris rapae TaxID=64459 RepID=UPI001E27E965|nr:carboxypeptidase B [Pieris rapae]
MGVKIFVILFLNFCLVWCGKHDNYKGCSVYSIVLRNTDDLHTLYKLEVESNLDIWQHGLPGVREAVVMPTPENRDVFFEVMERNGIGFFEKIQDVAQALEKNENDQLEKRRNRNNAVPFSKYPRYAEVDEYLERIARENPDIVTLVNAGASFEGRAVKYLKISTSNFTDTKKPIYFMDATIHAREWVTTPVALYSIHRLVEDLRDDERDLLEDIDWIILPIVNPDGYEYSHTVDRLWRRTRSYRPEVSETCYGVDGNRNFDVNFNTLGISSDPCSNVYPGPEPFSEPETQYVRDILQDDRIQIYLNIHSHGNYILYGFGNTSLPQNVLSLHQVGASMGATIDSKKLDKAGFYAVGNSNLVLYGSSGSAQDYGQLLVPFSYTLELPGYGYAFEVPDDYIDQINVETWAGIADSARLIKLFYAERINSES